MKTHHFLKIREFLKYKVKYIFIFFLSILFSLKINGQINFSKNSVSRSYTKPTKTIVVYIFEAHTKFYKGNSYPVKNGQTYLSAIINQKYFLNNKSKVYSKYPGSSFYYGIVEGKPKIIQNIYIEPHLNDVLSIFSSKYTSQNANYRIPSKIPIAGCEEKGKRCKVETKNKLQIYLTNIYENWEPIDYEEVTMPNYVNYKINKIIGVVNLKGSDNPYISTGTSNPRPEYIEFAHPLIPSTGVVGNYPYKN